MENLPQEIPAGSKVLIIFDENMRRLGILEKVKSALKGYDLSEFGGIEPNPTYEMLIGAVEEARKEKYDFLLAIGGGSVIDSAKFIAAAVPFTGADPWDILSKQLPVMAALPFGAIVTLPASGSEMNFTAVISRKSEKAKLSFLSPVIFPRFSILDPTFTCTLPPRQTGNGVVDTFSHVLEQYLTYPVNAKVQDRFSEGLLLTLIEDGPAVLKDPANYGARSNLMWAATWALNGMICSGVPMDWSTHMIAHEITELYGLDHAQTVAVVLPALLEVQKAEKREKLLQYAERVWGIKGMSQDDAICAAIRKTREFFEAMGLQTHLSSYGLGRESISEIASSLDKNKNAIPMFIARQNSTDSLRLGENGTVTLDIVKKVLELAL